MDDIERMPKEQAFWFGWGLVTLMAAAAFVVLSLFFGSVHVTDASQQSSLMYGWPLGWITQDQSSADPPLPYDLDVGDPTQFPTDVRWPAFAVDLAVFWLPLLVLLYVIQRSNARRTPPANEHAEID
jgi:hypothetical protein